jgi:hypothetical protein
VNKSQNFINIPVKKLMFQNGKNSGGMNKMYYKEKYNKNQQNALYIFSFIRINNHYMFQADLLLIIRRYYSVYMLHPKYENAH